MKTSEKVVLFLAWSGACLLIGEGIGQQRQRNQYTQPLIIQAKNLRPWYTAPMKCAELANICYTRQRMEKVKL